MLEPIAGRGETVTLPADEWMQGRTLYGGASALVAYTAAIRAFPDLPPLRSAQVAFVAPVGAEVIPQAKLIRQGRNVTQVQVDLLVDGSPALTSFWLFGAGREANAVHPAAPVEPAPIPVDEAEPLMEGKGPAFIQNNYELRRAAPSGGDGGPGAMRAMQRPGPVSSMNWAINLLDPMAQTRDGWWLAETASDHADHGYSSERLRLWDADGRLVMIGQQAAAVFG